MHRGNTRVWHRKEWRQGTEEKTEEICISNQTRASGSLSLLRKGREKEEDMLNSITQRAKCNSITAVTQFLMYLGKKCMCSTVCSCQKMFVRFIICEILRVCLCVNVNMCICLSADWPSVGEQCIDFQPKVQSHKSSLAWDTRPISQTLWLD